MNLRWMPRSDTAFRKFLLVYWDPLSHWSVRFAHSGLAAETASTMDSIATSLVARVSNLYESHCLVNMSSTLKQ